MSLLSIINFCLVLFLLYSTKNAILPYLAQKEFPYKDQNGFDQICPAQSANYMMITLIIFIGLLFVIGTVAGGVACWNIGPKIVF